MKLYPFQKVKEKLDIEQWEFAVAKHYKDNKNKWLHMFNSAS